MRKKILLPLILFVLFISFVGIVYAALTWSETQPAGDVNKFWDGGAMSEDGSTIVAITQNTAVYLSTDSGDSWSEVKPRGLSSATQWQTTAVSSDGQIIAVGGQDGMYISSNQGGSWTQVLSGADASNFTSVSMSPSGQYLIGGSYGGRLYTSTSNGTSWTERQPAGNSDKSWQTAAVSGDGQFMIAGIWNGRLYQSTDGGDNWAEIQPAGNSDQGWVLSLISQDGQNAFVGVNGGRLYQSTDGGDNWAEIQPAGNSNQNWRPGGISYDGQTVLLGQFTGRIYLSTNGGSSWAETQPVGDTTKSWWISTVSGDAEKFFAGYYSSGRLFLGSNPSPTPTPTPTPTSIPGPTSAPAPSNNDNSNPCPGFVTCPNAGGQSNSTSSTVSSGAAGSMIIQPAPGEMALAVTANVPSISFLLSPGSSVPVPWSQGLNSVGEIIQFNAVAAFNGYPVTQLVKPATIMMTYDPSKLNGRSPSLLRMGWFNPITKRWQILNNNTVVKPGENLIANTSTNLGYYTVVLPNNSGIYSPVLGTSIAVKNIPVQTKVQSVPQKQAVQISPKPASITSLASKKSCFLFICW